MNISRFKGQKLGRKPMMAHVIRWSVCLSLWFGLCLIGRADGNMPEYQVKALFLLNFTKYVDWPPNVFAGSNTPVTIGLYGESKIGEALKNVAAGKTVGGRTIVIRQLESTDDSSPCQILFISHSEVARMGEVLDKARSLPILTVGEDEAFARNGGIIRFVLKNEYVRLQIDLAAARKSRLTISSRLLAVAGLVKGKEE